MGERRSSSNGSSGGDVGISNSSIFDMVDVAPMEHGDIRKSRAYVEVFQLERERLLLTACCCQQKASTMLTCIISGRYMICIFPPVLVAHPRSFRGGANTLLVFFAPIILRTRYFVGKYHMFLFFCTGRAGAHRKVRMVVLCWAYQQSEQQLHRSRHSRYVCTAVLLCSAYVYVRVRDLRSYVIPFLCRALGWGRPDEGATFAHPTVSIEVGTEEVEVYQSPLSGRWRLGADCTDYAARATSKPSKPELHCRIFPNI